MVHAPRKPVCSRQVSTRSHAAFRLGLVADSECAQPLAHACAWAAQAWQPAHELRRPYKEIELRALGPCVYAYQDEGQRHVQGLQMRGILSQLLAPVATAHPPSA